MRVLKLPVFTACILYPVVEKEVFPRLVKNIQMQGARNPPGMRRTVTVRRNDKG